MKSQQLYSTLRGHLTPVFKAEEFRKTRAMLGLGAAPWRAQRKYFNAKCLAVWLASTACMSGGFQDVGGTAKSDAVEIQEADGLRLCQSVKSRTKTNQIEFKSVLMGDGIADGGRMYFTRYESSSGKSLFETWIYFGSSAKAETKVQKLLVNPLKKLRDSCEGDKSGKKVGKRVLVLRQTATQGETEAILAWNNGPRYQEIRSNSLEDVLAFEDQYRRPTKQGDGPA